MPGNWIGGMHCDLFMLGKWISEMLSRLCVLGNWISAMMYLRDTHLFMCAR